MFEAALSFFIVIQVVALLVLLFLHILISWKVASVYRQAYKVAPRSSHWPLWYRNSKLPATRHFLSCLIRPHQTLSRLGTRTSSELVAFDFSRGYPHGKVIIKKSDPN